MHRWLGLLMALQIIAWMASGLYFSIFPIAEIRGEHLTRAPSAPARDQLQLLGDPALVGAALDDHFEGGWSLSAMELATVGAEPHWRVSGVAGGKPFTRLVRPRGGSVVPRLSETEARARAGEWLIASDEPVASEWLDSAAPGSEYRGRVFPVWKIRYAEPESVNLYLDPWTGDLLARRTERWRIFDFLWMLHIMDFDAREDFNHPLLQIAALLGLVIALSGVVFWALTTPVLRRISSR